MDETVATVRVGSLIVAVSSAADVEGRGPGAVVAIYGSHEEARDNNPIAVVTAAETDEGEEQEHGD